MQPAQTKVVSLASVRSIVTNYGPVTVSFFLPFFLHDSQFLTGILVNFLLYIAAVFFSPRNQLTVILIPSLGTISRSLIFGAATRSLVFFLPFIWFGNYLLVKIFSQLRLKTSQPLAIGAASITKASVLSLAARSLVRNSFVSTIFIQIMGLNQLITAALGGVLACIFVLCKDNLHARSQH
ncbi:hypothetical protein MUP65_00960 [Patescibacteria group bacterium]|nr:hypothetical protein [Patescibacteria group bacterium]